MSTIRKLTRSQINLVARQILQQQGGLCPLCGKPIDLRIRGEMCLDHSHETGEVRGVLHRSCNSGLGKMENAVGHWGSKDCSYAAMLPWIERALAYYKQPPHPYLYPTFQTEDEKRLARNAKERKARADRKARQVVRKHNEANKSTD